MHTQRRRVQHRDPDDPPDRAPDRPELTGLTTARNTWPMDRQAAATFPGHPEAVATARRFVRITGAMWRIRGELLDDVELCMSELVGNAVTHTRSARVHCRLWSARGILFLEVDDEDGAAEDPAVEKAGAEDETGRGLLLIQTFTAAWGTTPRPGLAGKTVWAAIVLPSSLG
jgi:anti-sigma regulatory factor (Ser/Thr protein kinase)